MYSMAALWFACQKLMHQFSCRQVVGYEQAAVKQLYNHLANDNLQIYPYGVDF